MTEPKKPLHPLVARSMELAREVETASLQLTADLKYPVDAHGSVLDMNLVNAQHPDVLPALVHHLIKAGWRRIDDRRLIKARPVKAAGFYQDLVAWVPINDPDGQIDCDDPAPVSDLWSVVPTVTDTFEERQ